MRKTLLQHHKDNFDDAQLIHGNEGIRNHALHLGTKTGKDGQPLYPHLRSEDGIRQYVATATELMEGYKNKSTKLIPDVRGQFTPDGICQICPALRNGKCERGC